LSSRRIEAVLLDLDGVLTRTATLHAKAWKATFDAYLEERSGSGPFQPFDIQRDYLEYVDGKPRYEGVRSFLASRGIELPYGEPADPPERETICGLGNRKNSLFHELLKQGGVEVFEKSVEQVRRWRREGIRTAVVSSSRNTAEVLKAAGLEDLAEVRVDGVEAARLGLRGKPHPDTFLEAARRLGVEPERAAVVEDAISGVQAGRAGGFGLVVGVGGPDDAPRLLENGADVVVESLDQLKLNDGDPSCRERGPLPLLENLEAFRKEVGARRVAVFLDYDGTLTPIVPHPAEAHMSQAMRDVVRDLSRRCTVAIVSGRDLQDVRQFVQLDELTYAGSHGFDILGPDGTAMQHEGGRACLPDLDQAEAELLERVAGSPGKGVPGAQVERNFSSPPDLEGPGRGEAGLQGKGVPGAQVERNFSSPPDLEASGRGEAGSPGKGVPGAQVERKKFAIAVHYRNVREEDVPKVERAVREVHALHPRLRMRGGKKIFELLPDIEWDKGRAVLWLLEVFGLAGPDVCPVYIGDDVTDEDAFRALATRGVGIRVGAPAQGEDTQARYLLRDTDEVRRFLAWLASIC